MGEIVARKIVWEGNSQPRECLDEGVPNGGGQRHEMRRERQGRRIIVQALDVIH